MDRECYYSLDRIENDTAVLIGDDGRRITVAVANLPQGACEGKVYSRKGETYTEEPSAEEERRRYIRGLQERLCRRK